MDVSSVLATLVVCLGACAGHCPDGWVYFQGSCYLFSHEGKTFTEAEHFCVQHQAHLTTIDNKIEDTFLKAFVSDLLVANHWIGLSDRDIEGLWKWTDGSDNSYINWSPGQPNNGKSSNCVAFYSDFKYAWADEPCSQTYMPICEKAENGETDSGTIVG